MYSTQEARTELAFTLAKNAFTYMQAAKKKHWQVGEGWVTTLSGEPYEMLNEVLLFGANPDSVDEALAVLAEKEVPAYIKVIGPAQNVIPRLIERGYEFKYTSPVMTWQADNSLDGFVLREGLSVRRLDPHEAEVIWAVYKDVYEMPDTVRAAFTSVFLTSPDDYTYALYKGDELVSLVTAMVSGDFVGIWGMGTPKVSQKNGYGGELLKHVMKVHVQMGGKLFGLFASDAGKPLYDKLQWQTIEYIPHYGLVAAK